MPQLNGEQMVRLAALLPPLLTAATALCAAVTALMVSLHARRTARSAQRTAESATEQAREAAKEQIRFALRDVVRRSDAPVTSSLLPQPPKEGGNHE